MRALIVAALIVAAGCGPDAKPTPAAQKLPPEVEYDPATAAEKYKAAKKTSRP
jgi:hypothetical protein